MADWTSESIERLRALWTEGHSTYEIGRRMGISKNAVVGKAHRLELEPRPSPILYRDPSAPKRVRIPRASGSTLAPLMPMHPPAPILLPMPRTAPPKQVVTPIPKVSSRPAECSWPTSDGKPWTFCCEPVDALGARYCGAHTKTSRGASQPREASLPHHSVMSGGFDFSRHGDD